MTRLTRPTMLRSSPIRHGLSVAAVFVLTLLAAGLARAQPHYGGYADSASRLVAAGERAAQRHEPRQSLHLFELALGELRAPVHQVRAAGVLQSMGSAYRELDRGDSALIFYTRALDIYQPLHEAAGEGVTRFNIGVVHYEKGDAATALAFFRAALAIHRARRDTVLMAAALEHIGKAYQVSGHADSARTYYTQALDLARRRGDQAVQTRIVGAIGSLYESVQRGDSASHYYGKEERLADGRNDARARNAARVNRAAAYLRETTDPVAALADLAETLRGAEAVGDRRGMGMVLDIMGSLHRRADRADSALVYHDSALTLQRAVDDRRGQGSTLSHIAEAYGKQGRVDSALAYYHQALRVLREVNDGRGVGSALVNIGSLYHSSPRRRNLPRAAAYYDSAAAEIAEIARASGDDPIRVSFAEKDVAMYHLWSIVWLDRTRDRRRRIGREEAAEAALAVSERGRAQALRDLMRANATDSLRAAGAGPIRRGAGADLPAEGRVLAASVARGGTPVLSFLVTEWTLYTFLIVPGRRVEAFQAPVTQASVASLVTRVLDGLSRDTASWPHRGTQTRGMAPPGSEREAARAATELAGVLLPPEVRARLPASGELVIVPSGPLFRLPYAVLPLPRIAGAPSLLGLRYAIRYTPSLQVLTDLEARGAVPDVTARMLVVANPAAPGISLRGAEEEGAWVASLRTGTGVLKADTATEDSVRARLSGATLVHLAAHAEALADSAGARGSFISLAPGRVHDGKLTIAEVLDQVAEMRAEMVVLSACETGLGGVMRAEGAVGFQRAFLARGARGVLVSLWSVGDRPTNLLMQRFYRSWLVDGHTKAESLRLAQVAVADSFPDPRYWAGFQLVGAR